MKLPNWIAPRKRNKGTNGVGIRRAREVMSLPTNAGVNKLEHTKEDQWAGSTDKTYGEFYKKMSLSERETSKEGIVFYNLFNMYRKLVMAVNFVFYQDSYRQQAYMQMVCSGVMLTYIVRSWPCARPVDNVSKVVNELTFMSCLIATSVVKEMGPAIAKFTPGGESSLEDGLGNFIITMTALNLAWHTFRMIHNSFEAAGTIIKSRKQIVTKALGPPTVYDPAYSSDSDSGEEPFDPISEFKPKPKPRVNPDDHPCLANFELWMPDSYPKPPKPFPDPGLTLKAADDAKPRMPLDEEVMPDMPGEVGIVEEELEMEFPAAPEDIKELEGILVVVQKELVEAKVIT